MNEHGPARRSLSVVVPMLDAGPRVAAVHDVLSELVDEAHPDAELVLVDDASTDDTWTRIVELSRTDPRVVGLRLRDNVGQTSALCAGFSIATGRVVAIMDDDLECGPADLANFVAAVEQGAAFASGWRRGWRTPVRSLGSRLYNARLRSWGLPFHDAGCGANAMTLDLARQIAGLGWGVRQHRFKPAVATLTDQIVEVPFEVRPTTESHHGLRSLVQSWLDVEDRFGPLTPLQIDLLTIGAPAWAAVTAAVARRRVPGGAPRRFFRVAGVAALAALALVGADLRRRRRAEQRRERTDAPFTIAERVPPPR